MWNKRVHHIQKIISNRVDQICLSTRLVVSHVLLSKFPIIFLSEIVSCSTWTKKIFLSILYLKVGDCLLTIQKTMAVAETRSRRKIVENTQNFDSGFSGTSKIIFRKIQILGSITARNFTNTCESSILQAIKRQHVVLESKSIDFCEEFKKFPFDWKNIHKNLKKFSCCGSCENATQSKKMSKNTQFFLQILNF